MGTGSARAESTLCSHSQSPDLQRALGLGCRAPGCSQLQAAPRTAVLTGDLQTGLPWSNQLLIPAPPLRLPVALGTTTAFLLQNSPVLQYLSPARSCWVFFFSRKEYINRGKPNQIFSSSTSQKKILTSFHI